MDYLVDMFGTREPYKGELSYFKNNPNVAGMATEDNKIILNPFSKNSPEEQQAVAKNEAIRLFMKVLNVAPEFELTKDQKEFFKNTAYAKDPMNARRTILARILTNDPSAGFLTKEQEEAAKALVEQIKMYSPVK